MWLMMPRETVLEHVIEVVRDGLARSAASDARSGSAAARAEPGRTPERRVTLMKRWLKCPR